MKNQILFAAGLVAIANPAMAAATGFNLNNTNFVVSIAFVLFILVLLYLKVPKLVAKLLDNRSAAIRTEIDEARALQEEAKTVLASYERKRKEVATHTAAIVAQAKSEAEHAAEQAKADLSETIERRLAAAKDQIVSAKNAAVREVKDKAVTVAIAVASEVISNGMAAKDANALVDAAIKDVGAKLH